MATIDLNCDLGECDEPSAIAGDMALLDIVTSANIACGGHAGDEGSMERTVISAMERGVALGAHPSYPDRANFGRVECVMDLRALEECIVRQVEAFMGIVARRGGRLTHIKPHGALYHAAMRQRETAEAIARATVRAGATAILVGQAGTAALEVWRAMGVSVAAEAFADRRYEADGSLRARSKAAALIDRVEEAAEQAVRIATGAGVKSTSGSVVAVAADTICVHGDTPHSSDIARAVRAALADAGIVVAPLASSRSAAGEQG